MFDNISEAANNAWIWTWEGGSAWCLSGTCRLTLLQDRPFSAAASVCISTQAWKHGRLHIFQHRSTGYLRTRRQKAFLSDFLCMCIINLSLLHLKSYREPQRLRTTIPEHQGTGDFMRSECIHTNLYTLSVLSSWH